MKTFAFATATLISASIMSLSLATSASASTLVSCGSKGASMIVDQVPAGCSELQSNQSPTGQESRKSSVQKEQLEARKDNGGKHSHQDDRGIHNRSGRT